MPKNATILIIRHGEKPPEGRELSLAGVERAAAYVPYFQNFTTAGGQRLAIEHIFAAKSSSESERPKQTVAPLAKALDLKPDDKFADGDYEQLAKHILADPRYDGSTLLICWHHEQIPHLAKDLGAPKRLPSTLPWPPPEGWPEDVFGWVLVIVYDAVGGVDFGRTMCVSTALMYDDCGQAPPGPVH